VSIFTTIKVRTESPAGDSSPIEAKIMSDGRIRIQTDPDSSPIGGCWLTPAEIRELATDLLGLADASDAIYGDYEER
jgi:hypothetical protein